LIFFTDAFAGVLRVITRGTGFMWVSFTNDLAQLGDAVFQLPLRYQSPWFLSLTVLVGLIAACGLILERRIRGVEVVA
jgi:hypothetical protein